MNQHNDQAPWAPILMPPRQCNDIEFAVTLAYLCLTPQYELVEEAYTQERLQMSPGEARTLIGAKADGMKLQDFFDIKLDGIPLTEFIRYDLTQGKLVKPQIEELLYDSQRRDLLSTNQQAEQSDDDWESVELDSDLDDDEQSPDPFSYNQNEELDHIPPHRLHERFTPSTEYHQDVPISVQRQSQEWNIPIHALIESNEALDDLMTRIDPEDDLDPKDYVDLDANVPKKEFVFQPHANQDINIEAYHCLEKLAQQAKQTQQLDLTTAPITAPADDRDRLPAASDDSDYSEWSDSTPEFNCEASPFTPDDEPIESELPYMQSFPFSMLPSDSPERDVNPGRLSRLNTLLKRMRISDTDADVPDNPDRLLV